MNSFIQHGNTSCLLHSIAVAYYCMVVVNVLRINCDKCSLLKGALLHDYFLYDWHVKDKTHSLHGFKHPKIALQNAKEDFDINCIEENIIKRHMFPLTLIPPRYKESTLVCIVDKLCSIYEIFHANTYCNLRKEYIAFE